MSYLSRAARTILRSRDGVRGSKTPMGSGQERPKEKNSRRLACWSRVRAEYKIRKIGRLVRKAVLFVPSRYAALLKCVRAALNLKFRKEDAPLYSIDQDLYGGIDPCAHVGVVPQGLDEGWMCNPFPNWWAWFKSKGDPRNQFAVEVFHHSGGYTRVPVPSCGVADNSPMSPEPEITGSSGPSFLFRYSDVDVDRPGPRWQKPEAHGGIRVIRARDAHRFDFVGAPPELLEDDYWELYLPRRKTRARLGMCAYCAAARTYYPRREYSPCRCPIWPSEMKGEGLMSVGGLDW